MTEDKITVYPHIWQDDGQLCFNANTFKTEAQAVEVSKEKFYELQTSMELAEIALSNIRIQMIEFLQKAGWNV